MVAETMALAKKIEQGISRAGHTMSATVDVTLLQKLLHEIRQGMRDLPDCELRGRSKTGERLADHEIIIARRIVELAERNGPTLTSGSLMSKNMVAG